MRGIIAAGEAIRRQRRMQGLTQEQLAAQADCDVKTIRRAEHSGVLDMKSLKSIAAALRTNHVLLVAATSSSVLRSAQLLEVHSILRRWLHAFGENSFDQVLSTMHRGTVLFLPGHCSALFSGEHRGSTKIHSVLECLVANWTRRFAFKWTKCRLIGTEEAFIPFQLVGYQSSGAARVTSNAVFHVRLRNRKVSRLQIYCDTLTILKAVETTYD